MTPSTIPTTIALEPPTVTDAWVIYTDDQAPSDQTMAEFQKETEGLLHLEAVHSEEERVALDDHGLPAYPSIWVQASGTWTCMYRGPIEDQAIQSVLETIL